MLSDSIFSSFEARAAKFEEDLLITFNSSKSILITKFNTNLKLKFFIDKFTILMGAIITYLSVCVTFLEYKST